MTPAPASLSPDRVEGQIAVSARSASGGVASLFATILGDTPTTATVVGSGGDVAPGRAVLPAGWVHAASPRRPRAALRRTADRSCGVALRGGAPRGPMLRAHPSPPPSPRRPGSPRPKLPSPENERKFHGRFQGPQHRPALQQADDRGLPRPCGVSGSRRTRSRSSWETALDEMAEAGFSIMETGPFGYFPRTRSACRRRWTSAGSASSPALAGASCTSPRPGRNGGDLPGHRRDARGRGRRVRRPSAAALPRRQDVGVHRRSACSPPRRGTTTSATPTGSVAS